MPVFNIEKLAFDFHWKGNVGLAIYPAGTSLGPRTMEDYEFVWVIDGSADWECNGRVIPAPAGSIILSRPGMRETYRWHPLQQSRHAFFHFQMHRAGVKLPPENSWPLIQYMPEGDIIRPLFRYLACLLDERQPGWEEASQGAARQIFTAFLTGRFHTKGEGNLKLPPPVEKVFSYVQQKWLKDTSSNPTLNEMAKVASVSVMHLSRLFHQAVGYSPKKAIFLLRLDRAASLLTRSNFNIKQVSEMTGFQSQFHFSRSFKRVYGMSPWDFKKGLLKGKINAKPASRLTQLRSMSHILWD